MIPLKAIIRYLNADLVHEEHGKTFKAYEGYVISRRGNVSADNMGSGSAHDCRHVSVSDDLTRKEHVTIVGFVPDGGGDVLAVTVNEGGELDTCGFEYLDVEVTI